MIIYGWNPIREALRSHPGKVRYVAVVRDHGGKVQKLIDEARSAGVAIRFLAAEQLERLAGSGVHNGVVAEISEATYSDFDRRIEEARFVLILDGIQDPQNFGAILRVADAFAVDLVVIPEHESVGLTPTAVKASAGASEWVKVAQVTNLARTIEELKKREFWVYGAAAGGDPISGIDFSGKVALVVGNEGKGIRRNVLEHCDRTIAIPMLGQVSTLNVAAATAVICYEVRRGRLTVDSPGR